MDLLDGLLVLKASIAVPGVLVRQLLWSVELTETVVNANTFRQFLSRISFRFTSQLLNTIVVYKPIEAAVQCPTLLVIELD